MNLRSLTPLLNVEDTPRAIAFYRDLLGVFSTFRSGVRERRFIAVCSER